MMDKDIKTTAERVVARCQMSRNAVEAFERAQVAALADAVLELLAENERLRADLERLKEHGLRVGDMPAAVVEANAILEWVLLALDGRFVSDFGASFGPVQRALIRAVVDDYRNLLEADLAACTCEEHDPCPLCRLEAVVGPMRCPCCGGPADNGHDRELPPTPYVCTTCRESP
jgi:hypothetical protein